MRRTASKAAGLLAFVALAAGLLTAGSAAAPGVASHPWVGQYDFTRAVWRDGAETQIFIKQVPPMRTDCFTKTPDANDIFLVAAIDAQYPQGTSVYIPPGVVPPLPDGFGEPHHDDVAPGSSGTSPATATEACGFALVPMDTQPGTPGMQNPSVQWVEQTSNPPGAPPVPPRYWARAVDLGQGFVPLNDADTAVAALAAGLVGVFRVGSGGSAFIAPCSISSADGVTIVGTPADDVLCGSNGVDTIDGGGGNDVILGGRGNDHLTGGNGNDLVVGGYGQDRIEGGNGDDTLYGGWGFLPFADPTMPSDGNDVVRGGNGDDALYGSYGSDALAGENGDDTLQGGLGLDVLSGGRGSNACAQDPPFPPGTPPTFVNC
ncbi:MAG: hypothetical protein H0T97_11575 [Actinobacteria bacterium]|nr:hypothetical protein [Actinomycetota bacterium]